MLRRLLNPWYVFLLLQVPLWTWLAWQRLDAPPDVSPKDAQTNARSDRGDAAAIDRTPGRLPEVQPHRVAIPAVSREDNAVGLPTAWRWPTTLATQQVLDQLSIAAESGDARAHCLVAEVLFHCQHIGKGVDGYSGRLMENELAALEQQDVTLADVAAHSRERFIAAEAFCSSVLPSSEERLAQHLEQAARAGQRDAAFRFVEGAHLDFSKPSFLAKKSFKIWQEEALGVALDMALRGWPEFVRPLALAFHSDEDPFSAIVPNDVFQARIFDLLQDRLFGQGEITPPLVGARESEARRQADAMWSKQFSARRFGLDQNLGPALGESWQVDHACQNERW